MRGATECAKRLKLFFSSLRSSLGKVSPPAVTDPITQMLLGILSRNVPESKAREGLERLREVVVDYNELRVIPSLELSDTLGDFPDARSKAEDISRALNSVFAREHDVSLDRLTEISRKDTLAYLEELDGLDAYTVARIRLLGLRQHAIPLDEAMWALACEEEIVNSRCPLAEAQQFLERQIAEEDALEFVALMQTRAWELNAAAVHAGTARRILSIPPDRSFRNMLQMISMSSAELEAEAQAEPPAEPASETPAQEPAKAKKSKRATTSRSRKTTGESTSKTTKTARKKPKSTAKPKQKSTTRKKTSATRSSKKATTPQTKKTTKKRSTTGKRSRSSSRSRAKSA